MKYGYKRDPIDPRDKNARHLLAALPPPPERASLRDRAGALHDVLDQRMSDCVANATARALQVALTPAGGTLAPLPSRDFIYFQAGVPEGDPKADNGRYIRDAFSAVSHLGWPDESVWPYTKWPTHPGGAAHRAAFDRRAELGVAYHRITETGTARVDAIKRAIAGGFPLVFGTDVTEAFEDQNGKIPLAPPHAGEQVLGGHAIAGLEYDPDGLRFCNSWSGSWANDGWGYLSWAWMQLPTVSDLWIVQLVPGRAVQS